MASSGTFAKGPAEEFHRRYPHGLPPHRTIGESGKTECVDQTLACFAHGFAIVRDQNEKRFFLAGARIVVENHGRGAVCAAPLHMGNDTIVVPFRSILLRLGACDPVGYRARPFFADDLGCGKELDPDWAGVIVKIPASSAAR